MQQQQHCCFHCFLGYCRLIFHNSPGLPDAPPLLQKPDHPAISGIKTTLLLPGGRVKDTAIAMTPTRTQKHKTSPPTAIARSQSRPLHSWIRFFGTPEAEKKLDPPKQDLQPPP